MALLQITSASFFGSVVSKTREIPAPPSSTRERGVEKLGIFSRNYYTRQNRGSRRLSVRACCFNLPQEPILREALKEPIAFVGGMFAGLLRLDLNEDPLKEWVTRTVEASGITEDEVSADGVKQEEEAPQQIEIE